AYGDLLTCDDEMEIYSESHGENGGWVIPETVGEYTGLTDKNGVKIFEGDICHFYGGDYYSGGWEVNRVRTIEINAECLWYLENAEYIKIIGNIHDNPELLEGAAKMSDAPPEQLGLAPAT
ncbi:MAG: hypothetical protein IJ723_03300, partial [Ruminococcus sp.]|nr:hypothetical protein [Ruminococcus sp.]